MNTTIKTNTIFFFITMISLVSCSPKIRTSLISQQAILPYDQEVFVYGVYDTLPEELTKTGSSTISDSGFTKKCTYDLILDAVKLEARKSGANIVKIIEHKSPDGFSTCHRIKADLYYAKDTSQLKKDSSTEHKITLEGADYALLHVYRYRGIGPLISYNLRLGDSILCRVKNNFKTTIKIKKEGLNTLWTRTETKVELPVDIEYGKEYYLRCAVKMGAFVGRPTMELVDYQTGKVEFEAFEAKHNDSFTK